MSRRTERSSPVTKVLVSQLIRAARQGGDFHRLPIQQRLEPARRPAHAARMLALAQHIQWTIDRSSKVDRAEVARHLGFSRARITHLLDLTLLAPDIQASVVELEALDGVEPLSERSLRDIAAERCWATQRTLWRELRRR